MVALGQLAAICDLLYVVENTSRVAQDMMLAELLAPGVTAPAAGGARGVTAPATGGAHGALATGGRKQHSIGPVQVCKTALLRILGVGWSRATRLAAGKCDLRFGPRGTGDPRSREKEAFSRIYGHLWRVYESVAECLAEATPIVVAENPFEDLDEDVSRGVDAFTRAMSSAGPMGAGHHAALTPMEGLPQKALPPGVPKDYWWTYLATPAPGGAIGSYTTFKRVRRSCFKAILGFRAWGTHASCNTCEELRSKLRLAEGVADKLHYADLRRQHLERQWRDRMLYWRLRATSQADQNDWLCIMIDGADQAKFRIMKATRWPKDLDSEHRPKVKVVGALAHGHEIAFSFVEEDVPKGSNLTIELLTQTLSRVMQSCADRGRPLAAHVWIQCDNAGGENKNQWLLRYLAVLTDRGVFRSCVLSFLQVGHTHEDLDGIFGVMSMEIAKMMEWDTPMQMLESGP